MFRPKQIEQIDQSDPIQTIEAAITELPESYIPPNKAQLYALKFNKLAALSARIVMDLKQQVGDLRVQAKLLKRKAYAESTSKTVEERRLDRDCNEDYLGASKDEESIDARIEYAHTLTQVCKDYHIYFRQISGQ